MYHVISTGITATILYLLSLFLFKTGFYSRNLHRRLWNIIMAVIFIPAAAAGLFLALQVTYKWNIPIIKSILKWHVETGIAFAFTGIFHTLWHLPYFFTRNREQEAAKIEDPIPSYSVSGRAVNLFFIGMVSTSVQLLLMREMMNIAGGYELITGTFLASWLIGSAAGSFIARQSGMNNIFKINLVFGAGPIISLALLIFLYRLFFNTGESPGFLEGMIYSLIVLLPVTFITGFAFIRILVISAGSGKLNPGKSFSIETSGGVAAGVLVSIAGAGILNTYQMLLIVLVLFSLFLLISRFNFKGTKLITGVLASAAFILLILIFNPDKIFRQLLLPGIKVEQTTDTPYGNITEGSYGGEKNLYYDHHLFRWKNDEADREENIHYAMLQHPDPKIILLISGDIRSNLPEVMKYNVSSVTYVERDPQLAARFGFPGNSKGILRTESSDAFRYLSTTNDKFDVIIVNLPPPSTLMLNRFYTTEFYRAAAGRLEKGGIFMCSPGTGVNYFNAESATLYSSVFNSLSAAFSNVLPIVGNKLYYIASEGQLSASVCALVEARGLKNTYVNSDFLADDLIKLKSDEFISLLDRNISRNTLLFPIACFHFQNFNLSMDRQQRIPAILILVIVFLIPVFTVRSPNMLMYGSAGALAGFEIIMLLILQSAAGNMYQLSGMIIAGFMAGLALGSGPGRRWSSKIPGWLLPWLLVIFYMSAGLVAGSLVSINHVVLISFIIMVLSIIPAFLTGRIFGVITENTAISSVPSVYGADMAGAAFGFIVVSGIAVPLLGIRITLYLLSSLILTGVVFGRISYKS